MYKGKLQKNRWLAGFALVLWAALSLTACGADGEQEEVQTEIDPKAYEHILSAEAYEKITDDMTPEQVLEVAGVEPYQTTTTEKSEENPHSEIIYMWYADPVPNRYTVSFLDNKLENKDFIDVIKLQEEGRKNK